MSVKDFLYSKLQELSNQFNITFSYQFDSYTGMHLVEIKPSSSFNNEEYAVLEYAVTREFDRTYCPESLLFVPSNDLLIQVNNPELVIKPNFAISQQFQPITMPTSSWATVEGLTQFENVQYAIAA